MDWVRLVLSVFTITIPLLYFLYFKKRLELVIRTEAKNDFISFLFLGLYGLLSLFIMLLLSSNMAAYATALLIIQLVATIAGVGIILVYFNKK